MIENVALWTPLAPHFKGVIGLPAALTTFALYPSVYGSRAGLMVASLNRLSGILMPMKYKAVNSPLS